MAKRLNPRRLRAALTYDVKELARALGITDKTVRAMINRGMPVMSETGPTLILGAAAREFIEAENSRAKQPCTPDQLYCFRCKAPTRPWALLVDLLQTGHTTRLEGICEVCEAKCSQVVSAARLPELATIFDIATNVGTRP